MSAHDDDVLRRMGDAIADLAEAARTACDVAEAIPAGKQIRTITPGGAGFYVSAEEMEALRLAVEMFGDVRAEYALLSSLAEGE